jgi:hypothetical protein
LKSVALLFGALQVPGAGQSSNEGGAGVQIRWIDGQGLFARGDGTLVIPTSDLLHEGPAKVSHVMGADRRKNTASMHGESDSALLILLEGDRAS